MDTIGETASKTGSAGRESTVSAQAGAAAKSVERARPRDFSSEFERVRWRCSRLVTRVSRKKHPSGNQEPETATIKTETQPHTGGMA